MSASSVGNKASRYEVYVFLHDECIISRYYTIPLAEMAATFDKDVRFIGVFPNGQVDDVRLQKFKTDYKLPFELQADPGFKLVDRFDATVTPEVFVVDTRLNQLVYQGRIDNAYARVGRKRTIVTKHELHDVLTALASGSERTIEPQLAIGCIITRTIN